MPETEKDTMENSASSETCSVEGYKPKSILLTGGAGFIGSHVVKKLVENYEDYKIVVVDKLGYCSNLNHLSNFFEKPNFKFIQGDIRSSDFVIQTLKEEEIDTIMHFAAETHVDNSFGNSFSFTSNNIVGTQILLEASRGSKIRRFLHVSTDEVYGENTLESASGFNESHRREPTNPYAATKAAAEIMVKAYGRSYGIPYVITRGNNVYGPQQYPEKAIPLFLCLAKRGDQLPIYGNGSNMRSFLYVDDVADAFDIILHQGKTNEVYNISTKDEKTVKNVAKDILEIHGRTFEDGAKLVKDRPHNDLRYFLDNTKLLDLGWEPKISWDVGLKQTAEWYACEDNLKGWKNYESALEPHAVTVSKLGSNNLQKPLSLDQSILGMGSPRFLVFGKTGWIGGLLGNILTERGYEWCFAKSRLENRQDICNEVNQYKPTHILNAAGLTGRPNVDWCEDHKEEVIRVNVCGTLNLADVSVSKGIHCIMFATGCIFEYDDSHPQGSGIGFTEDEVPNFTGSYYSKTKGLVESLLRDYKENICVLRVRMPISSDLQNNRNFIYKIKNYAKIASVPNSMTVLDELLPYSIEMALRKLHGVYNFTNPGVISHNEILDLYRDYLAPDLTYTNFSLDEQAKILKAGRSNNELDSSKLKKEFPEMLSIRESVIKFVFDPAKAKLGSK